MKLAAEEIIRLGGCLAIIALDHIENTSLKNPIMLQPIKVGNYQAQLKQLANRLWCSDAEIDSQRVDSTSDILPEAVSIILRALASLPEMKQLEAVAEVERTVAKLEYNLSLVGKTPDELALVKLNDALKAMTKAKEGAITQYNWPLT
ncbi:hypothetical protein [Parashewanella tropica]|uniref:hypothetical protein n=1 Tax=Parashewanella tropica TaxID=2547970 RepID=UPI0014790B09|nr:hypothetical protein [Parashewanella tropica]